MTITDFAGVYILKKCSTTYYIKWVKGLCMTVTINIKASHHCIKLFKLAGNGHYLTLHYAKIRLHSNINSVKARRALGASCNYSFLKHCTQVILRIYICILNKCSIRPKMFYIMAFCLRRHKVCVTNLACTWGIL